MTTILSSRKSKYAAAALVLAVSAAALLVNHVFAADDKAAAAPADGAAAGAPPPMPISVAVVEEREATDWKEFSGRLRAVQDVEIRPRVGGAITSVHFQEGDVVQQGTELLSLDARPYQAALAQAEAAVVAAKAQVSLTSRDAKRAKDLIAEKAVSQRELDEKRNADAAAQAELKVAQAQRDLAALDVEYSKVLAPITGRVGRVDVTVGNVVKPNESILTTMQSTDPIYVDFDIDEQAYLSLMKAVRVDNTGADMPVYMALADEKEFNREGRIKSFDNQLAGSSGTLRVRAIFDNKDGFLTPGLFARVRLGSAEKAKAIIINDSAISTDQSKRYVWVVGEGGAVQYREVTLGPINPLGRVIASGLKPGEKIVVNGLMRVHPGMTIQPSMVSMDTLQPVDANGQPLPQGQAAPEGGAPADAAAPADGTAAPEGGMAAPSPQDESVPATDAAPKADMPEAGSQQTDSPAATPPVQ